MKKSIYDRIIDIINDIAQSSAEENYINNIEYKDEEIIKLCIDNLNKLKNNISAK